MRTVLPFTAPRYRLSWGVPKSKNHRGQIKVARVLKVRFWGATLLCGMFLWNISFSWISFPNRKSSCYVLLCALLIWITNTDNLAAFSRMVYDVKFQFYFFHKLASHLYFYTKVFCLWEYWDFNLMKQFRRLISPCCVNSKVMFLNSEETQTSKEKTSENVTTIFLL